MNDIQVMKDWRRVSAVTNLFISEQRELCRTVEVYRKKDEPVGICLRRGDGIQGDGEDGCEGEGQGGIFIASVTLGSLADEKNLIHAGDEITQVNGVSFSS